MRCISGVSTHMKMLAFSIALLASPVFSAAATSELTENDVSDSVRRSVDFAVTPDPAGFVASCEVIGVTQLPTGQTDSEFIPSPEYIAEACSSTFAKRSNWLPETDSTGAVIPKHETCLWSAAVPDSPICRAELALDFAEEIPKGIGKTVVFELTADRKGILATCSFAATYSLSGAEALDEVPHAIFVKDGCRKFQSVLWVNADRPAGQTFYMPCRLIDEIPSRAFCDRKFGE